MTQQKIQNLDPSKARDHDKISIHMIQLRGNTFCKLEEPNFKQSMESGSFPSECEKWNEFPIHKKDENV